MNPPVAPRSVAILLLAAGSSARMGNSKQLLSVKGKPLLLLSVEAALGAGADRVVVVLGAREKEHRKIIHHLPIEIINNTEWEKGMGNSLKKGLLHVLAKAPGTESVMVMVCDQPMITSDHLKNLMRKGLASKNPLVASAYVETTGVPALFDQSLFQELLHLEDSAGAKKMFSSHPGETIEFPGGEIDLDTPEDYQSFKQ